jgi:hypothetical protein
MERAKAAQTEVTVYGLAFAVDEGEDDRTVSPRLIEVPRLVGGSANQMSAAEALNRQRRSPGYAGVAVEV